MAWDELWDRFSVSDPGLLRLSNACTVVASILLTLLVLGLSRAPVTMMVAGALAAMVASFAVSDPRPRDQAVTLALGLCVAIAVTATGAELYHHRSASDVLFVALIFTAVYVRRFGPRGTGLGVMAFQLYFVSQFTRTDPASLPRMCAVLALAFAAAATSRFGLVRATPERTLDRLRRAFRARLAAAIEAMAELAEQRPGLPAAAAAARQLQRRTTRLHQCALLIQARLENGLPDARAASLVERRVAEAEIAAERLGRLLRRALSRTPPEEPNPADPALRATWVQADERGNRGNGGRCEDGGANGTAAAARLLLPGSFLLGLRAGAGPDDPDVARLGRELRLLRTLVLRTAPGTQLAGFEQARDRLLGYRDGANVPRTDPAVRDVFLALGELTRAVLGLRMAFGYETDPQDDSPHTARSREELETEELSLDAQESGSGDRAQATGLDRISTRLAFQVAAGSALAILGGELLSTQRWYWAVLTCWVVFINTSSTGDILIKGYRRLAGTVAGVLAGGALASVVNGDPRIAFALAIACVFGMFFTVAISYALMSFFVTTMIGLLYTLLGIFSPSVLVLRIEETALGAACGFLAAVFVLPVRASQHTDQRLVTVLDRLRETLSLVAEQLTGETEGDASQGRDVLHAARDLDSALDSLHASMEPLTHPVNPLRIRRQRARYIVRLLDSCAYHVRSLAAISESASDSRGVGIDPGIEEVVRRLDRNAAMLADFLRDQKQQRRRDEDRRVLETEPSVSGLLNDARPRTTGSDADSRNDEPVTAEDAVTLRALRHLQRIDEALLALSRPLGLQPASAPGGTEPAVSQPARFPA